MQNISSAIASPSTLPSAKRIIRKASPTEMIYIATKTIVVSRSQIAGLITRSQFNAAVAHLETRFGILRAVVENGNFVERVGCRPAVETWVASESCSADAMYARLLNAELDTSKGLYGLHVVVGEGCLDIFMLSSHAITDATSLVELHSCLAYMCDCIVRDTAPTLEPQEFPNAIDAAVSAALGSPPEDLALSRSPSCSSVFAQIPTRTLQCGNCVNHRLARIVIDADQTSRISAASHEHGSSVHSLLLAAFALAIREVTPDSPRRILMRSNVDLRRRLKPYVSTDLVFSAITARVTLIPDLDLPVFELAKHIFNDIHQAAADGSIFRAYIDYPTTFGSPDQAPIALNISDMQTVRFSLPMERLKVTGFEYALGWLKKYPNVSISIHDGRLVANVVFVEEFVHPEFMRTISERFVRILNLACRGIG